jgi:uncharacterized membrane protein
MTLLIIGLALFMGVHLIPSMGNLRSYLAGKTGEEKYKGIIGLISLAGFALIIWGYSIAPVRQAWEPVLAPGKLIALLMLLSVILFVSSAISSNVKRIVRHPQLTAVVLFSSAHLLVNGDLASIILFGSFLLFSLIAIISALIRKLGADTGRQPVSRDIKVVVIGIAIYAGLIFLHPYLFGVPAV